MATASSPLVRASLPLARTALGSAAGGRVVRALRIADAATRGSRASVPMPAAVRIERSRSSSNGVASEQTALTLWFGEGPSLPSPGQSSAVRSAARVGMGVAGAVALAVLTAVAARREEQRHVIEATATLPR